MITNNTPGGNEEADTAHNDDAALETSSKQGSAQAANDKTSENDPRIETVVPDNDN